MKKNFNEALLHALNIPLDDVKAYSIHCEVGKPTTITLEKWLRPPEGFLLTECKEFTLVELKAEDFLPGAN